MTSMLWLVCVLMCGYQTHAEDGRSVIDLKNNTNRNNFTGNDLIQFLSKLARQESKPRLRFPTDDYDETPDDPFYGENPNFNPHYDQGSNIVFERPSKNPQRERYPEDAYQNEQNLQNVPYYPQEFDQNGPYFQKYKPGVFQNGQYAQKFPDPSYINQGPFYRPPRKRKQKKRPSSYPNPFPISQDPLDPYFQNYPPYQDPYQQRPGHNFPPYPQNYPPYPQDYPQGFGPEEQSPFGSLMNALSSIAKHDDQKCVPRLLCEVAAGGNPSYRQNSFLPSFASTESLFTLLSALTGGVSPLLVFGRAALLGVMSQGSPTSCRYAYPDCPRDPDRLVEYLNNHNGGFFRFFNGLTNNLQDQSNDNGLQNYPNQQQNLPSGSQQQQFGLNQLTQLFGQALGQLNPGQLNPGQLNPGQFNPGQFNQNTRPYNQNEIYSQRPSYYPSNGEFGNNQRYPYRFKYQNRGNTNNNSDNDTIQSEARILNKPGFYNDHSSDSNRIQNLGLSSSNDLYLSQSFHDINLAIPSISNGQNGVLKFPDNSRFQDQLKVSGIPESLYTNPLKFPSSATNFNYDDGSPKRPKTLFFPGSEQTGNPNLPLPKPLPFYDHTRMIFPDRTGTGNLKFDSEKLTPIYRPDIYRNEASYYQGSYNPSQYQPSNNYQNQYQGTTFPNQYQSSTHKKRYVYIVRGNGDPNHPEIVEDNKLRRNIEAKSLEPSPPTMENRRDGQAWTFPSPYQGVIYDDNSFSIKH